MVLSEGHKVEITACLKHINNDFNFIMDKIVQV